MKKLSELKLKGKKYIIFDMDGTLIDSIGVWNRTDQKLIEDYGGIHVDLDEVQRLRDGFLHGNQDTDIYLAFCEYLINKYNLSIKDPKELLDIRWNVSGRILEDEIDYKLGVVQLLSRLKELGFVLVLATMTTQVQLDIYTKKNKKMLDQMNINDVFDLITRKEDVKNKKPDPEIYNMIMKYYDATPDECLIFEDSYTGVLASKNAGVEVVNIYDKYADLDRDKINEIADYCIENYGQFLEFLNYIFSSQVNIQLSKQKILNKGVDPNE